MEMSTPDPVTPVSSDQGSNSQIDGFFIGALICLALGAILLIIGFMRLIVWAYRVRKDRRLEKLKLRHLAHMRYLEEYSIKAGDSPNDVILNNNTPTGDNDSVFKWDQSLVNMGYVSDETLRRHSPKEPKLSAHMNGSSSSYSRPRSQAGSVSGMSGHSSTASVSSSLQPVNNAQQQNGSLNRSKDSSLSRDSPFPYRLADVPV